jgi:hypothetical protein
MNSIYAALNWLAGVSAKDLFAAAIGSLAGAWGGAYAIQWIADNAKRREKLGNEVLACNAAIELCGSIGNTYASLKRQHVMEFAARYERQFGLVHAAVERRNRTGVIGPVDLGELDMTKFEPVRVRIERLEKVLTEQVNVGGRPVGLLNYLIMSIDNLNDCINQRNEQVDRLKGKPNEEIVPVVFGLKGPEGTDKTYPDMVRGIARATDDCLVFTMQMCLDLEDYCGRLRKIYLTEFRGVVPRVSRVDFSGMEKLGLMPNLASYSDLINAHVMAPRSTLGRRGAKAWLGARRRLRAIRSRGRRAMSWRLQ